MSFNSANGVQFGLKVSNWVETISDRICGFALRYGVYEMVENMIEC